MQNSFYVFEDQLLQTMQNHFHLFADKMLQAQLPEHIIRAFEYYYQLILNGETGNIYNRDIRPISEGLLPKIHDLDNYETAGFNLLPKTVHIVLNGGLGTSMGLIGPKSLLRVKNGMSFLEIALKRAFRQNINLAFMNSFNTEDQTIENINRLESEIIPFHFMQNKFPKVVKNDLKPVSYPKKADMEWNPPGHGDIYVSLYASGLLDALLAQGIRYAFVSNVDNLRATVEPSILGYFAGKSFPFMMEVAHKTVTDVKGGHLAQTHEGRLILRELGQCPADELNTFFDLDKYPLFNTNNIWLNLEFLYDYLQKNSFIPLPMILNSKTVDYRDPASSTIYQVESAMGAAISIFKGASAIHVPRIRLLAVKTCNDLLAVRSDCYKMNEHYEIESNPRRPEKCIGFHPQISLDPTYYKKIDDFEKHFTAMPSLLHCDSFVVEGNFHFGENVVVEGNVKLTNTKSEPVSLVNVKLRGEIIY